MCNYIKTNIWINYIFMVYITCLIVKAQINYMWSFEEFKMSEIVCLSTFDICISNFDTKCTLYHGNTPILFPMKALKSLTPILSPLLSKMWCGTTLFQLGPFCFLWCNFIGLAMRLLNQWYWVFLVKPKCDHPFFHHVHFNFDNWNALAKMSCVNWSNMASYTQCLSSLFKIPYPNNLGLHHT